MRRAFAGLLGLPMGYVVFAFAGYRAIELFSSNSFDRSVEAPPPPRVAACGGGGVAKCGLRFCSSERRGALPTARMLINAAFSRCPDAWRG